MLIGSILFIGLLGLPSPKCPINKMLVQFFVVNEARDSKLWEFLITIAGFNSNRLELHVLLGQIKEFQREFMGSIYGPFSRSMPDHFFISYHLLHYVFSYPPYFDQFLIRWSYY